MGRGWGGGPPTRSAAGAARLYNLRLPTEGLRQGHGHVAGAQIEGLPPMPPTPEGGEIETLGTGGPGAVATAVNRCFQDERIQKLGAGGTAVLTAVFNMIQTLGRGGSGAASTAVFKMK